MSNTATDMDAIEIAEFLETQHTGVLSLAKDDDGYGIPVSFVYTDDDEGGPFVYFRLGYAPGSMKRRYIDASNYVSFIVCDETEDGWKSVIARGRLEEISARSLDAIIAEVVRGLDIPYFYVHDRPVENLNLTLVRLKISDLKGIVEGKGG
ncbi:pyridoxamine 5'-phosphate oxidase family protein [Salinigranum salinum]|uniref:pyridoxamine 5'-phosphate oxidase family protein n=1 Tax=Salinigranum salinum TaxID=1364937 RepID=UPI00126106B0|nr:pyridoxamine 5'-phosphate oxidase family protein [Salinigranum salinum]